MFQCGGDGKGKRTNTQTDVKALCFGKAQTHTHASHTFCVHEMRQVHAWVAELETCISVHLGLGRRECMSAR